MALKDFISRFQAGAKGKTIAWAVDPYEGLDFIFPKESIKDPEGYAIENPLFGMQLAYLKALDEQGMAMRNSNGFTLPSDVIPSLDQEFFELFELPGSVDATYELDVRGNTGKSDFSVKLNLCFPNGHRVPDPTLYGPFLKLSEREIYSLSTSEYSALKALQHHAQLSADQRGEYENNWLILQLQMAKKGGMPIDLAHFNNLELSSPESIGVSLEELPNGDLLITPSFGQGINIKDLKSRLGQITPGEDHCILRIKDKFVLLDEERLKATEEILTNRSIPKSQVANFLKAPTAYLNAALINLDTGFSLRVHGAERFVHRYFGDVEKSGVDWFATNTGEPEPFQKIVDAVDSEEAVKEIEALIADARSNGAEVIDYDKKSYDITNTEAVSETIRKINDDAEQGRFSTNTKDENGTAADKPAELERAVVAIDSNDEQVDFQKDARVEGLDFNSQTFDVSNLKRTAFPHQEEGIKWLLAHFQMVDEREDSSGALLADDMGLGKTFMTLVAIAEWNRRRKGGDAHGKPTMIVAPLSLLENWQAEVEDTFIKSPFTDIVVLQSGSDLKRFRIEGAGRETQQEFSEGDLIEDTDSIRYSLKVGSVYGTDRLDMPVRLVLTTYQTLRDYQFSLSRIDWGVVAFDEAQNLKNPNTLATRAAKGLKADFKLLATGTPVENSLKDFWCLMDTSVPGLLGSWQDFRSTYISPILSAEPEDVSQVRVDVGRKLRSSVGDFMLRRTKAEKLKGLPEKRIYTGDENARNDNFLKTLAGLMKGQQLQSYDEIIERIKSSTVDDKRQLILPSLHKLKVTSIHPSITDKFSPGSMSPKDLAKQATISSKIESMILLLNEIKQRQEKVLIFATTKAVQAYVSVLVTSIFKIPVEIINGETKAVATKKSAETRKSIIDQFQSREGFGVIVMSPIAAGVGLTVVGANNVIHLERHWNPAKEAQATDRVYRIGQKKDVNVYVPMALHPEMRSFDVQLNSLLENKVDLSDAVVAAGVVEASDLAGCF